MRRNNHSEKDLVKSYLFNISVSNELLCLPNNSIKWFVFHTKSRREKKIAEFCYYEDIHFFLPLRKSITYSGKRKHIFYPPLIPGYFFCCINWEDRYKLYTTNCIANTIKVKNQERFIQDLSNIKRVLDEGGVLIPVKKYENGTRVKVNSGPFMGLEGEIITVKDKNRLVLHIDEIGNAVSLEIDADSIEEVK